MKKFFTLLLLLIFIDVQAQAEINRLIYLDIKDGQAFEEVCIDYGLKVAQAAVDNKGMLGWNVWKKIGKSGNSNYVVAIQFKDIDQATGNVKWNGLKATGIDQKHIKLEWNVVRDDLYRIHSSIPGESSYVVINYSKPTDLGKHLSYEVDYITPVMKELISKNQLNRTSWNVQAKIYPSGTNEKYSMFTADGYASFSDALKSQDFRLGVNNFKVWDKAIKKVHGNKTMEGSIPNGFEYKPIYKLITRTK